VVVVVVLLLLGCPTGPTAAELPLPPSEADAPAAGFLSWSPIRFHAGTRWPAGLSAGVAAMTMMNQSSDRIREWCSLLCCAMLGCTASRALCRKDFALCLLLSLLEKWITYPLFGTDLWLHVAKTGSLMEPFGDQKKPKGSGPDLD
jgi:hypothetical protein